MSADGMGLEPRSVACFYDNGSPHWTRFELPRPSWPYDRTHGRPLFCGFSNSPRGSWDNFRIARN